MQISKQESISRRKTPIENLHKRWLKSMKTPGLWVKRVAGVIDPVRTRAIADSGGGLLVLLVGEEQSSSNFPIPSDPWSVWEWCSARCRTHRGVTGSLKISPLALLPSCPPCPPCPPCCLPTRAVLLIGNNRISLTWSLDTGSMTYRNMVKGGMHGCKLLIGMIMQ